MNYELMIPAMKMSQEKYQHRLFTLLWIRSLRTTVNNNRFRVIFRDANGMFLSEEVQPEELAKFTIGSIYKAGKKLESMAPLGVEMDLKMYSGEKNRVCEVREVLTDQEYDLNHWYYNKDGELVDLSEENKRQYCVVLENDFQQVIFPCVVIGSYYYFLSSSMTRQIFSHNLEGLYEEKPIIDRPNRTASIILKQNAADSDACDIVRFATNDIAYERWEAIKNNMTSMQRRSDEARKKVPWRLDDAQKNSEFVPFVVDFPVVQDLDLRIRGTTVGKTHGGKDKILVFDILADNSDWGFDQLTVYRKGKNGNPELVDTQAARRHKTSKRLVKKIPWEGLSPSKIELGPSDRSGNTNNVEVTKETIREGLAGPEKILVPGDKVVNPSLNTPGSRGDKGTRPGQIERAEPEKPRHVFNLDSFLEMAGRLRGLEGVADYRASRPKAIPDGSQKRFYLEGYGRQYIHVTFTYDNRNVCLVEIDQTGLEVGSSIFVLVAGPNYVFSLKQVEEDLLEPYLDNSTFSEITNGLAANIGIFRKKHPPEVNKKSYHDWCVDLLSGIRKPVKKNKTTSAQSTRKNLV